MAVLPSAKFPLSEKEQAEVICLFNKLRRQRQATEAPLVKAKPLTPRPPRTRPDLGSQWGLPGVQ